MRSFHEAPPMYTRRERTGSVSNNEDLSKKTFGLNLLAGQQQAYWVALRVTKSPSLAEDAVQEAYASLLSKPPQCQEVENMRGYFLTAVHKQALMLIRSEKRRRRREDVCFNPTPQYADEEAPVEEGQSRELALAARTALNSLPLEERTAVSLCCEQGLTREAAAGVLGIPKPTLTRRVNRGLEKLRKILARQGYTAATPAAVGAALSSLPPPTMPASLAATLHNLATNPSLADKYARSVSVQALSEGSTKNTTGLGWILIGSTLAVAIAGGLWRWNAVGKAEDEETKVPETSSVEEHETVYHCWTFEKGPPEGFKSINPQGWLWRLNPETKVGEMVVFGDQAAAVVPPITTPKRPFVVTITSNRLLSADVNGLKELKGNKFFVTLDAGWESLDKNISRRVWVRTWSVDNKKPSWRSRNIFMENHTIQYQDDELSMLKEYERPCTDEQLVVMLQNCAIGKIEIRTLTKDEITDELREPRKNIERYDLKPKAKDRMKSDLK